MALALFDTFFRVGSLVFGGGHVVLPLLQAEVVPPGWVTNEQFLAGYGAAQAVPGPLFTFSAYLGAAMAAPPNGVGRRRLALVAIFLPSFLLVFGALPFWGALRAQPGVPVGAAGDQRRGRRPPAGGALPARLDERDREPADFALALAALGLLALWKLPPWLVVAAAAGGAVLARGTRGVCRTQAARQSDAFDFRMTLISPSSSSFLHWRLSDEYSIQLPP